VTAGPAIDGYESTAAAIRTTAARQITEIVRDVITVRIPDDFVIAAVRVLRNMSAGR